MDLNHIHPMIVHFPIALLIIGFLFETAGLFGQKAFFGKAALYLLVLGTLGVLAAYITGDIAGDGISEAGTLKAALESHESAALLSLWIMLAAAVTRIAYVLLKTNYNFLKWTAFVLFLIGVISIARTGYYGGNLVYKHAAGVEFNLGAGETINSQETDNNK